MITIPHTRYTVCFVTVLFIAALAGIPAIAQNTHKFNVRINAGPALASGQLASKQFNSGGYALSGFSADAEGIWYFRPSLGVGIAYSETKFPFADKSYALDMVNSDPSMEKLYLKSDFYQVRTLTAGLYYCRHLTGKFSVTGKLTGGVLWAETPDQLFAASFFTVPNLAYKITPSRSTKATFQPGLAVQYQLFEQVGLTLNADYTLAVAAFGFQTASDPYIKKITFSYLNTMIGIDFKF